MDEIDRITNLPEDVVQHIFDFLTTKQAVQTCLSSPKWINLWTRVSHLHFDEDEFNVTACMEEDDDIDEDDGRIRDIIGDPERGYNDTYNYVQFINSVLHSHDTASALDKFRIHYRFSSIFIDLAYNIADWVTYAMMRNVRELDIDGGCYFYRTTPVELPASLFNSHSLQVLKLKFTDSCFVFPASIHLPNLKRMHLDHLYFVATRNSSYHSQLSSANFPSLEDLVLDYCGWHLVDPFTISAPILNSLNVRLYGSHRRELGDCKIVNISAPSLRFLTCNVLFPFDYKLTVSSRFVRAYLQLPTSRYDNICDELKGPVSNFLSIVARDAKELKLSKSTMQLLYGWGGSFAMHTFNNLTHLTLSVRGTRGEIDFVFRFLCHSPMLRYLTINFCAEGPRPTPVMLQSYFNDESLSSSEEYLQALNSGVFNHLKMVCIYSLVPNKAEIQFINFILENAWALEQMAIGMDPKDLAEMMLSELSHSPRVSKSCVREGNCVDLWCFSQQNIPAGLRL